MRRVPFSLWMCSPFLMQGAYAALPDEIQVYTDEINRPGKWGLELHVNTTPAGNRIPAYPGEVTTNHGFRVTPELSYGINGDWEAGLYVPTVRSGDGGYYLAGARARIKWIPVKGPGGFGGMNLELYRVDQKFSDARNGAELRFIAGYEARNWLLSVNPVFNWGLLGGFRTNSPDGSLGVKLTRKASGKMALGAEYYSDFGKVNAILPYSLQSNTLYAVMDYEGRPFNFNFGIGRGLTHASDNWTIKSIVEFSF